MKHREGTLAGWQGTDLYYQSWHPDEPSQAVVTLVHGLGGYSNVFQSAVEYLVPQGYEVYAFDLRGHGRSAGQRGHINEWAEFREDLRLFLRFVRSQRTSCPMILWGHSLGGTIVLDYVLRSPNETQGLIVTAPALGKVKVPIVKLAIGRMMSRIAPRFSLRLGLRHLGKRSPIVEAYLQDPLRHDYASARLATEYFSTVRWIYHHAPELTIPLLIMHGSNDHVALPEGSREFFQRVIFPDKEHREYPGNYHDLYMDSDCELVFSDLEDWLRRHLIGAETCQPLMIEA